MTTVSTLQTFGRVLHGISLFLVACLGMGAIFYTIASALGYAPWLTLPLTFGETSYPLAGMYLQIAATVVIGAWAFFLPTNARIVALENSHRRFEMSMNDIARAYHLCHTADRAGVFTMSSEFDQVRERLAYLRDHPDLERLEHGVLEVAAQMSQQSRHLADVYSDEKVARAKEFLRQRQEEAENQQAKIVEALHYCQEIRTWAQQVELEESIVASQLSQLDEKLQAALPILGYALEHEDTDTTNVVELPKKPAAE